MKQILKEYRSYLRCKYINKQLQKIIVYLCKSKKKRMLLKSWHDMCHIINN